MTTLRIMGQLIDEEAHSRTICAADIRRAAKLISSLKPGQSLPPQKPFSGDQDAIKAAVEDYRQRQGNNNNA